MATNTEIIERSKELVYGYIQQLAAKPSPEQAIDGFYDLLWNRVAIGRDDVRAALETVLAAKSFAGEEGQHFLNRCFYSIGNPWHLNNEKRPYLAPLIAGLEQLSDPKATNPLTLKLRRQIKAFDRSEYGQCLRRQMRLGGYQGYDPRRREYNGTVADILPQHFSLYRSATRTRDIANLEDTYENVLRSGTAYRQLCRLKQSHREIRNYIEQRQQGLENLHKPTRLPTRELDQCLTYYRPQREGSLNQRARQLDQQMRRTRSYGLLEPMVRDYLMTTIEPLPVSVKNKMMRSFYDVMKSVEAGVPAATPIIIQLFKRLLDAIFLTGERISGINQLQLCLEKAGSMPVTSVLLSIVLASPMVRFPLERKLGFLYDRYENQPLDEVPWLVNFLEHMNLALVMNAEPLWYFSAV